MALFGALATGCAGGGSGDGFEQPPVSDFRAGACTTLAPDILSVGRDARRLGTANVAPPSVQAALKQAQDRLRAAESTLEADVAPMVSDVVVAIGAVRLSSDTGGLTLSIGKDLSTAYQRLVDGCIS